MGQDFKLYASKETRAAIPPGEMKLLEELLPKWSGRNVVLVSAKDTIPGKSADTEGITPDQLYTKNFRDFLNGLPLTKDSNNAAKGNTALQDAYSRASTGNFAASEMPAFKNAGIMTVAVDYTHLNEFIPSGLSGIPAKYLKNIPGTSTDWMLATVAHETGHLASVDSDAREKKRHDGKYSNSDDKLVDTTNREIKADRIGLTNYFGLRAKIPDINPDVPKTFMELRAIGTIRQSGDVLSSLQPEPTDHATNPAIKIDGSSVSLIKGARPAAVDAALLDVNTRIHLLLGIEYGGRLPEKDQLAAKDKTDGILGLLDNPAVKAEAAKQGKTVQQALAEGIGKDRLEMIEKIGADPKGRAAMTTLMEGAAIAHDDPLKEYAAVRFLYEKGEFKTETQKRIAAQYMEGIENHLPVNGNGVKLVQGYMADMEKDWKEIQAQEKAMPYIQKTLDITKAQLREPHAVIEAAVPPAAATV